MPHWMHARVNVHRPICKFFSSCKMSTLVNPYSFRISSTLAFYVALPIPRTAVPVGVSCRNHQVGLRFWHKWMNEWFAFRVRITDFQIRDGIIFLTSIGLYLIWRIWCWNKPVSYRRASLLSLPSEGYAIVPVRIFLCAQDDWEICTDQGRF